jgi:hypothetical protein
MIDKSEIEFFVLIGLLIMFFFAWVLIGLWGWYA